jgi:uncharacterized protein YqeY
MKEELKNEAISQIDVIKVYLPEQLTRDEVIKKLKE